MSAEAVWSEEEESLDSEVRRDPLAEVRDEVERRTSSTAISIAREKKARATRRTLYLLIGAIVGLLLNVFGIFLYVTFAERFSATAIWYLWVDGLVSGIAVVYTLGLVRTLHDALAASELG